MAEPVVSMTPDQYFVRWLIVLTSLSLTNGIILFFAVRWAIISAYRSIQALEVAKAAGDLAAR